jgi:outer membrane protein TolC
MKKIFLLVSGLGCFFGLAAQTKTVTLQDLKTEAIQHYAATRQRDLYQKALEVSDRILRSTLYPRLNLTGSGTYQSEVTSLNIPGSSLGLPEQKKDQYKAGLETRYNFNDLFNFKTQKKIDETQTESRQLQADIDIQHLKEQIDYIFANILYLEQNKKITTLRIQEIGSRMDKVTSAVKNGVSLPSNLLALQSDQLSSEQKTDELNAQIQSLVQSLGILTNRPIDTSYTFTSGEVPLRDTQSISRPETRFFEKQQGIYTLQQEMVRKNNRPQLFVFGQGYYGRPGFNFLNNDLRFYGIGGVGISWNINSLANQRKNQELLEISKAEVNEQKNLFDQQTRIKIVQEENEIDRYKSVIGKDSLIVAAREAILKAAASQLENGVITSTEYITELNALDTARLNAVLHTVQLFIAKQNLNTTLGY